MDTGELDVHLFSPTAALDHLPAGAEVLSTDEAGPMGHRVVRLRDALDSHIVAFAAEQSRLTGETVRLPQLPP